MMLPRQGRSAVALVAVALGAWAGPALAAPQWVRATPFGGPVVTIAGSVANAAVLYANTPYRIYRSDDAGETWSLRHDFQSEQRYPDVRDLVVDPRQPSAAYALTSEHTLIRTLDGGDTWTFLGPKTPSLLGLIFDTRDAGVLIGASFDGLYRSSDQGRHWVRSGLDGRVITSIAVDGRDADVWFAAERTGEFGETHEIWTSHDHGSTWTAVRSVENHVGLEDPQPRFVSDAARPGVCYFYFRGSYAADDAYRTEDGGRSWSRLTLNNYLSDVAPSATGALLVASYFGLSRSVDFGATFTPPFNDPAFAPREHFTRLWALPDGTWIAGGSQGVWRSQDDGLHWSESNRGLTAQYIGSIVVAPNGPEATTVVAGRNVFRSPDRGASWRKLYSDYDEPFLSLRTIAALDPRFPRTLYGVGDDGILDALLRTKDGGRTWVPLPFPFGSCGGSICELSLSAVTLDPKRPERVYLGGYYFFHFVGRGNFLFRSDDGFETWKYLQPLASPFRLAIDPDGGTMFGLTCRRLYRSKDGAESWRRVGLGLPTTLCSSEPVLALGAGPAPRLYVGVPGQGVFVSSDTGATFSPMHGGLEKATVGAIVVDPSDAAKLYAGVPGRGIWAWSRARRTWEALGEGLPVAASSGGLAIDPRHPNVLYAGTSLGLFRIDLASTP